MGLDMYLDAEKNIWGHSPDAEKAEKVKALFSFPDVESQYITVGFEAMYWRKANAIHNWFVENVQDGNDDCGRYYVCTDQLQALHDLCVKVIATVRIEKGKVQNGSRLEDGNWIPIMEDGDVITNVNEIKELLTTTSGFFFGSTDYDEYFLIDVKETAKGLAEILKSEKKDSYEYYYHSSW